MSQFLHVQQKMVLKSSSVYWSASRDPQGWLVKNCLGMTGDPKKSPQESPHVMRVKGFIVFTCVVRFYPSSLAAQLRCKAFYIGQI